MGERVLVNTQKSLVSLSPGKGLKAVEAAHLWLLENRDKVERALSPVAVLSEPAQKAEKISSGSIVERSSHVAVSNVFS